MKIWDLEKRSDFLEVTQIASSGTRNHSMSPDSQSSVPYTTKNCSKHHSSPCSQIRGLWEILLHTRLHEVISYCPWLAPLPNWVSWLVMKWALVNRVLTSPADRTLQKCLQCCEVPYPNVRKPFLHHILSGPTCGFGHTQNTQKQWLPLFPKGDTLFCPYFVTSYETAPSDFPSV